jgi:hypothetical protein
VLTADRRLRTRFGGAAQREARSCLEDPLVRATLQKHHDARENTVNGRR